MKNVRSILNTIGGDEKSMEEEEKNAEFSNTTVYSSSLFSDNDSDSALTQRPNDDGFVMRQQSVPWRCSNGRLRCRHLLCIRQLRVSPAWDAQQT